MPFRSIVASPEELAQIVAAFEKAWSAIEARGEIDPLSALAERERLGYIVAAIWKVESAADLSEMAIKQFDASALRFKTEMAPRAGDMDKA